MDAFIGFKAAAKMRKKNKKKNRSKFLWIYEINCARELQRDKTFHSLHTFIGPIVPAAPHLKQRHDC